MKQNENKQAAVLQDLLGGARVVDVAKKYKVHESTVYWWLKKNNQKAQKASNTKTEKAVQSNIASARADAVSIKTISLLLNNGQRLSISLHRDEQVKS